MASQATVAPVLSTPDIRIAESPAIVTIKRPKRTDEQLSRIYEVERTVSEIKAGKWKRIALQFPDNLLPDAPKVYQLLSDRLPRRRSDGVQIASEAPEAPLLNNPARNAADEDELESVYILADTSYGSCCPDEIAAEHVDAEVIVHYGRACLSPTARLPVIHVFTAEDIHLDTVASAFNVTYSDKEAKVILMADAPYQCHIPALYDLLQSTGYSNLFATSIIHNPSSSLPNRTTPPTDPASSGALQDWALFHVSNPPPSLLLTLSSRVASIHFYPTDLSTPPPTQPSALQASASQALRRRYALLTQVSRASIIGILVNTLSVHSYENALRGTQARIAAAGKKSYVFAMGRPNPAKVANFAEVDGWVVLGCWESSLIENSEFDKPLIAPFELDLALKDDKERVWTGEWRGDFRNMTEEAIPNKTSNLNNGLGGDETNDDIRDGETGSESESEPPEFDLRTGRYILPSRPMGRSTATTTTTKGANGSHALARRAKGDLAIIGGELSPGAQYLKDKRTWRGLGSDFEIAYEEDGTAAAGQIKEGRSGIARGYEGEKPNGHEPT